MAMCFILAVLVCISQELKLCLHEEVQKHFDPYKLLLFPYSPMEEKYIPCHNIKYLLGIVGISVEVLYDLVDYMTTHGAFPCLLFVSNPKYQYIYMLVLT